jgi:Flp pilus assembly protein TadD
MPTITEALNLANAAASAGDLARAQTIYLQILAAVPECAPALDGLGMLYLHAGQPVAAAAHLGRAIAASPGEPQYHFNLGQVHDRQGRPQEAAASYRRALELDDRSPELHNALAVALQQSGELESAVASFRDSIARRSTDADVHYNLARTLFSLGRYDQAIDAYRRTIELAPQDFEAHNNLGTILQMHGHLQEAAACFETTLRLQPHSVEAHRNRALLRLQLGDFAQGWPEYEWRWRVPNVSNPNYRQPRWEGQPLANHTLLLWPEQGFGDAIQFVRFAAPVKALGARVLLACPASLRALFATVPFIDRIVTDAADEEHVDYQIPLLSLPGVLGTALESIPANVPYLFAEPERIARWRRECSGLKGFTVGIAWQGRQVMGDEYRSMPLACFEPLARVEGVQLVSLQRGQGSEQLAPLSERLKIVDLAESLDQQGDAFVDTAAVMMNLDLVVTSDTSIAHLAGALGVPVWVALSYAPDWRWLLNRTDSPWYPTMRLFRQSRLGQWEDVFAEIAAELRSRSPRELG